MKSIKAIIIDDEAPARRRIHKLVLQSNNCEIIAEAENGKDAIRVIKKMNPELLFLDIQLKDMTGFDVLERITPKYKGSIIFITAYDEYAIKAFEQNAIDYLLKPFKNDRFQESLSRAINIYKNNNQPTLTDLLTYFNKDNNSILRVLEGKIIHYIDKNNLIYIKSENFYCNFYLENKPKVIRISLKKTATLLPSNFIRINRSVIINSYKISSTKKFKKTIEVKMLTGEEFTAFYNLTDLC